MPLAQLLPLLASAAIAAEPAPQPNILLVYADDVGVGDVQAYGFGTIPTPHIDALAENGVIFTDAYATSATCTPSRFSLLTGRYPFRNTRAEILDGDAPLLIEPGSLTVASHLAGAGYRTAVIGKWHLGLGDGQVDWNAEVSPGPLEIGFGTSYLLPATNDRVPCVYLDGHTVVNLDPADPLSISFKGPIGDGPTGKTHPELRRYPADNQHNNSIINRISRIGWQAGGHDAEWVDEQLVERFTQRAIDFIETAEQDDTPWFLYFNLPSIHVPRAPGERFQGKSEAGIRGDSMLEADWSVGELTAALDRLGIAGDTLVIFTSDNGPILDDGYTDGALETNGQHLPSGPYKGGKYTPWEGGTRVPFIAAWPGHAEPARSRAVLTQLDLFATFADLAGAPLPGDAEVDSEAATEALLGADPYGRETLVTQSVYGLSIREGDWKYIRVDKTPAWAQQKHNQPGNPLNAGPVSQKAYLYNLKADPSESTNIIEQFPDIAQRLAEKLAAVEAG